MTRIDPSAQWGALLRNQLETMAQAPARPRPSSRQSATGSLPTSQRRVEQDPMALRIGAIGDGDPDRRRKAFKIFLETTLVNEFGHVLRGSPDFDSLVDQVAAQMFEDPALRPACEKAADSLLTAAHTS